MGRRVRCALAGLAGLAGALALAAPAAAHVTVNPSQADPGSYTKVVFQVPTESDTASTTKLQVYLPAGAPIASVDVEPVPGWTATVKHSKLAKPLKTDDGSVTEAVSEITWTASRSAAIKPGQFQEFPVSLGPLPRSGSVTFKALQTYSNGTVVRWIETSSGGAEPANPAPVLTIAASATPAPAATAAAASSTGASAGTALTVAILGLAVGALGLILAGFAVTRSRRVTD